MLILLEEWAKKNKIKPMNAKNWARYGKFKTAVKKPFKVERWVISSDEKLPITPQSQSSR